MPAPIVLVHDDRDFLGNAEAALRAAGIEVAAFSSSLAALEALEQASVAKVLVARDNFAARGDPNGISLVLVARRRRPTLKAVILCAPESARFGARVGSILEEPVTPAEIVGAVTSMLAEREGPTPAC
jgi:DNA-binding NtrC family response regulator